MKKYILLFLISAVQFSIAQNPVPAQPQTKSILLMNGTAHLGNGKVIENSAIGFRNGKLTLVADATTIKINRSEWDTTINIPGKQVYPGIIAPGTNLGLHEVGAVRATKDDAEVGWITPHVRAGISYNTDSKIPPTSRSNGVLIAQVAPSGGLISGTSSIMNLDGWNWEDAVLKMDDGIHMNWPRMQTRQWIAESEEEGASEKNKEYEKIVNTLEKFFADAKSYNETAVKEEENLRFEAMKGVFSGTQSLFIYVDNAKEITESVNFAKKNFVKKIVIVGGRESWMVADFLKENNVSVIVYRIHSLPARAEEDIDLPYKLPAMLKEKGVMFCLSNEGGREAMQTRNLPFIAGTAAAYGLSKEDALKAVTLDAAKILGIDKSVGSLEEGKDATLFVSDGDALDMKSNNVTLAFIQGKKLNLQNEQYNLYKKYMDKYGLK